MVCSVKVQKWTAFGFSFFLFVSGLLLVFLWENSFNSIIREQLTMEKGTYQYNYWLETPVDINLEVYLFNWTNVEEFKKGSKPNFQQIGPYVYSEKHTRANVVFNSNKTISFNSIRTWKFRPEKSNGSMSDLITVMNPIVLAMGNVAKRQHYLIKRGMHYFLKENEKGLDETRTAEEFLFTGIDDIMMDIALKLKIKNFKIPYDRFGWFYSRNGSATYDGTYTMWTGTDDIQKTGIMTAWNGHSVSTAYEGECGRIDGSTGEVWYPTKNSETISMFLSDVCSLLTLEKQGTRTVHGIEGNVYAATDRLFDNGSKYPETACFNPHKISKTGVRDISDCKYKAPAFLSFPHFHMADPSYREAIGGMKPDPKNHKIEMVMEPTFGFPLEVHITMQANFILYQVEEIGMLANLPNGTMVPYLWVKIALTMPDNFGTLIKVALKGGVFGQWLGYVFILISLVLFVLGVMLELRERNVSVMEKFQKMFGNKMDITSSTAI